METENKTNFTNNFKHRCLFLTFGKNKTIQDFPNAKDFEFWFK